MNNTTLYLQQQHTLFNKLKQLHNALSIRDVFDPTNYKFINQNIKDLRPSNLLYKKTFVLSEFI